jgi:hypothetical protein
MELYSDAVWFWRVNEGVKGTKMKPWKSKLAEDEIWKVIAYESTFGLKGQEYDVEYKKWVPHGTAGTAPAAAPGAEAPAGDAPAAEAPAGDAPAAEAPAGDAPAAEAPAGDAPAAEAPAGDAAH